MSETEIENTLNMYTKFKHEKQISDLPSSARLAQCHWLFLLLFRFAYRFRSGLLHCMLSGE